MITFIAPCYNGETYVGRFLESILKQTYNDIQVILVNDGSTDGTEQILKEYEEKFSLRGMDYLHLLQENAGIGAAINKALKYVTGDYLTWFGSDDLAYPTFAEELVGYMEAHRDIAVVRPDGDLVREDDPAIRIDSFTKGNNDKDNPYLFENAILERGFHFGYSVVRMSVFDQVNPKRDIYPSRQGQNWQLLLPVFYEHKAAFYHKSLYAVVDNANSVSRDPHKSYEKLKKQNEEYENILVSTLQSMKMDDSERCKYLQIVKEKYIRRRMCAAIDFSQYNDAIEEYYKLKKMGVNTKKDYLRYLRAKNLFVRRMSEIVKR